MLKHRIMALVLALVLVAAVMPKIAQTASATTYALSIGGVSVTDENKGNIDGNGKIAFNPDTNTLTLDNYVYNGSAEYWLYCHYLQIPELTIYLKGANSIVCSGSGLTGTEDGTQGTSKLTITGEIGASLDIQAAGDFGIYCSTLQIEGVTVSSNRMISAIKDMYINKSTVIVNTSSDTGIYVGVNFTVDNSDVEALGSEYGIFVNYQNQNDFPYTFVTFVDQIPEIYSGTDKTAALNAGKKNETLVNALTKSIRCEEALDAVYYWWLSSGQNKYVRMAPVYTVTYDLNGGTADSDFQTTFSCLARETITLPTGEAVQKAGCELSGWKGGYSGTVYGPGTEYTVTDNVSFAAAWEVLNSYIVTIPATVSVNDTLTVTASEVKLPAGKKLDVICSTDFLLKSGEAQLPFQLNDNGLVESGSVILTVPAGTTSGEKTLNVLLESPTQYAGTYTGTITFTVAVNSATE